MYKIKNKIKNELYELEYYHPKLKNIIYIDKEIKRIYQIKKMENIIRKKFNISNFTLFDKFILENKQTNDPILCQLTKKVINDDILLSYLNKEIIKLINYLNNLKFKKKKVKKIKIKNNKLLFIYNNYKIFINLKTYNRIKSQLLDNSFEKYVNFDTLLWILYYRYIEIGLYNNSQLSVHPNYYNEFKKKFNLDIECFGSFFNHTLKYYFGIFPDLEKYFGCLGNFYDSKFIRGFYIVNPPYTSDHILNSLNHLLEMLKKSNKELYFLFVIPAWVYKDRINLNKQCKDKVKIEKYKGDYNNIMNSLKKSKYLNKYLLYCKENYKFYSYLTEQEAKVAPINLILISNQKKNIDIESIFGNPDI
jgi:hypothetical protein